MQQNLLDCPRDCFDIGMTHVRYSSDSLISIQSPKSDFRSCDVQQNFLSVPEFVARQVRVKFIEDGLRLEFESREMRI